MGHRNRAVRAALGAAAIVVGSSSLAQSPLTQAFAALPAMQSPTLSPDGTRLAFISYNENGSYILVADLDGMKVTNVVDAAGTQPRAIQWASGDSLVFLSAVATNPNFIPGQSEITSPYGVDLGSGAEATRLLEDRGGNRNAGSGRLAAMFAMDGTPLVGFERGAGRVLFPKFDADKGDRVLYAVNPKNDQRTVLDRGPRSTVQWVVDAAGQPVYRVDYDPADSQLTLLGHETGRWEVIVTENLVLPQLSVYGLGADGNLVIGMRSRDVGRFGLYALAADTGKLRETPVYVDDQYDVASARLDPYTNRVVGASLAGEGTVWFDRELAEQQALLDETFPGESPAIASWSEDRKRFIVVTDSGDRAPGVYFYDTVAPSVDQIATTLTAALQNVRLPARRPYSYKARDGAVIQGYLTRPLDTADPTPLVVLPHGGPATRDVAGFDWMAHFLASRGYTVLQPNFRGSGGFGAAWESAGFGQWGVGVMQHDLSDGVAALIEAGLVDAGRVCIVGASYGGYAALAGAVFTPELYRCAAAFAPVTDLADMLGSERDRRGANAAVAYWRRAMGGGDADAQSERLRAASPAAHAGQARAAILLMHDRDDVVVPLAQSETMERALREAGKDAELVTLDGDDHWLSGWPARLAMLRALDVFLTEHLQN